MTEVSRDEWHTVEVGVPLVFKKDDDTVDWVEQQATVHHTDSCPHETISHGTAPDGTKVTEIIYRCNLACDGEFYGLGYWITEVVDISYGVWRVQAYCTRDYHGEYDMEYDVERLEGPVDEREFEEAEDDCDCVGMDHQRECRHWVLPR